MIFFNQIAEAWASYFGMAILQNTIFLVLVYFVLHLLRKADARIKYMIGVLGIIKLLLPPFIPGHFSLFSITEPVAQSVTVERLVSIETVVQEISMTRPSATAILFMIWVGSAALYLIISSLSSFLLRLSLESAKKLPTRDSLIDLYVSKNIFSPLSMGMFPNRIYVPDYWNAITEKGRKVLLQHELAHIERKDGFVQFLQTVVQALYFFHPFVWLLNERINEYREMACDDYAIEKSSISPGDYSRYLIDIAEKITDPQWSYISASALIKQKHKLLNRVTYQLQEESMQKRSTFKTRAALLILALLILPLSWYCSQENKIPQAPKVTAQDIPSKEADIFTPFDKPPEPIGGFTAIQKNLIYPEIALKAGIEGRVIINCLIDEKGSVVDTNVLMSLGNNGCDEAAIKAIKAIDWKPATQKGKPVKVWIGIPVVFKLDNENTTDTKKLEKNFATYDVPPQPIGGFTVIQKNLIYPELARKAGIEGRVVINCLIDENGQVVDTKILQGIGSGNNGCDQAAIAAIKSVSWKPATQRDKPVKVWIGIPIVFKLDEKE